MDLVDALNFRLAVKSGPHKSLFLFCPDLKKKKLTYDHHKDSHNGCNVMTITYLD
jgi:hypothetical protein